MFYSYKVFILLSVIFQFHCFISVSGECCPSYEIMLCKPDGAPSKYAASLCLDCSEPDLFCAHGNCNVFGCNCDGGCRTGNCSKACTPCTEPDRSNNHDVLGKAVYNVPSFTLETIMQEADLNKDGLLHQLEALEWLVKNRPLQKTELASEVKILDKNKDGYLSRQEIDGKGSSQRN